jgi:hypothetical protein
LSCPRLRFMRIRVRQPKTLDFDIESRPLSFTGSKFNPNTKEITAIAAQFVDEPAMYCWLLGVDEPKAMLEGFLGLYAQADIVTGHYIRGFDLPHVNASCLEYGLSPLSPVLTQDTCSDLKKLHGIQKGQEPLAHMLEVASSKYHPDWREANRLTEAGVAETRRRVTDDVTQHMALRKKLLDAGWLNAPKWWKP